MSMLARLASSSSNASPIKFVGGTTASAATVAASWSVSLTSLTGGLASAPAAGDLVVVYFAVANTYTLGATGYTGLESVSVLNSNTGRRTRLYVAYKLMGATPDTSITLTSGTSSGTNASVAAIQVWRGVAANPSLLPYFDVPELSAVSTGNGPTALISPNPPAITPLHAGAIIVAGGVGVYAAASAGTFTSADLTGFQSAGGNGSSNDVSIGLGYKEWTSGTFDPGTFTFSSADNIGGTWAAVTLALAPSVSPQALYGTPGTYNFVVPAGVTSISAVAVGGGRGGGTYYGGAGGNLRYKNSIAVTPGETLTVIVGAGGAGATGTASTGGGVGSNSSIDRSGTSLLLAGGGGQTTTEVFDGGGTGGNGGLGRTATGTYGTVYFGGGGGGGGGYAGVGGSGGGPTPRAGVGGGGGGGGRNTSAAQEAVGSSTYGLFGAGGGGVGVLGQGSNGTAGSNSVSNAAQAAGGGSGGTNSAYSAVGSFGGGGAGGLSQRDTAGVETQQAGISGGNGAVRIIWPGDVRLFPSTRTADE